MTKQQIDSGPENSASLMDEFHLCRSLSLQVIKFQTQKSSCVQKINEHARNCNMGIFEIRRSRNEKLGAPHHLLTNQTIVKIRNIFLKMKCEGKEATEKLKGYW